MTEGVALGDAVGGTDGAGGDGGSAIARSLVAVAAARDERERRREREDERTGSRCTGLLRGRRATAGYRSRRSLVGWADRCRPAPRQCPLGYRNAETEPDPVYRRLEHDRAPGLTFSRRGFLHGSGLALAGATLYACTGGGRKAPVVTPIVTASVVATETRWPIKRVIYLMMENRSFDNLFGRFPGANGATRRREVRAGGAARRRARTGSPATSRTTAPRT